MSAKLLDSKRDKSPRFDGVISARRAADRMGLAHNTFFKALDAGIIHPQAKIEGDPRPAYGFEEAYLDEISKVLPKDRIGGQTVFTREIKAEIEKINRRWAPKGSGTLENRKK